MYHAWKGKNKKTGEGPSQEEQRVPQEIAELAGRWCPAVVLIGNQIVNCLHGSNLIMG